MNTHNAPQMLASVDLGSNSFRLQICQNNNGQLQVVDSIKEMVRFAAGLDDKKYLDEASRQRALSCLSKFGERLRGFSAEQVRAVATNTFRVAKNIAEFIPQAEAALGFPIEIIAGREEARLIYTGVVHTLPPNGDKMLVVDIGGGSTEFVIGSDIQPMRTESLPLGCVTYSMRFFQNKIDEKVFQTAITAARTEIQRIAKAYKDTGWDFAVGTSGSAKSIRDVLAAETGNTEETISYPGMKKLMQRICEAGSVKKAKFAGLKADRLEVFAGGLAVMLAVFEELGVQTMTVTDAALRDGVFYDFIGRSLNEDMREQTVTQFQQRYHVSLSQADRVAHTASILLESLAQNASVQELNHWRQYLRWAAKLHEIGIDIAYTAYHKHTAYILDHTKPDPQPEMVKVAQWLEEAGADYIAIACNTAHYFYDAICKAVSIPVLNIMEETARRIAHEIGATGAVGLLATDGTIRSGVFQNYFRDEGLSTIEPDDADQRRVMSLIYQGIKANGTYDPRDLVRLAERLHERGGDAVVVGCTELSVIYQDLTQRPPFLFDSLDILAERCVETYESERKDKGSIWVQTKATPPRPQGPDSTLS